MTKAIIVFLDEENNDSIMFEFKDGEIKGLDIPNFGEYIKPIPIQDIEVSMILAPINEKGDSNMIKNNLHRKQNIKGEYTETIAQFNKREKDLYLKIIKR